MTQSAFASHDHKKTQALSKISGAPYKIGYYRPNFSFQSIDEFMAVLDKDSQLIALTGPSTSRTAALNAKLFASAPGLLSQLKTACQLAQQILETLPQNQTLEPEDRRIPEENLRHWLDEAQRLMSHLENCHN